MNAPLQPLAIQKIGATLAIAWSDGREDYHPLDSLRKACPCAACCGEPDVTGQLSGQSVDPASATSELSGWSIVGGYGWQPKWADGHSTGIYSFGYLRKLGEGQ